MAYNMTPYSESTNLLQMFDAINDATGNLFAYMVVVGVFIVVLFTLLRNNPPAESFMGASTVLTVFCLMFLLADLVNIVWVIGSTILMAVAATKLYFT